MIGFINFLCLLLLFFNLISLIVSYDPGSREKIGETVAKLKKDNLTAIFISLSVIVLEVLVRVDHKLWEKLFFENSEKSYSLRLSTVPSPIFRVDYFKDVWDFSLGFSWVLIGIASILLTVSFFSRFSISEKVIEELKKREAREAARVAKEKAIEDKNNNEAAAIAAMMSHYDKVILVDENVYTGYKGWAKAFYVNLSEKKIIASGRLIDFANIISCSFVDNSHVVSTQKGTTSSNTKADNGSVIGRAVVGGLVAGGAGAVVGGATAKKNTTTNVNTTTTTRTIHDYTVIINIKDIISPVCEIHCGDNEKTVNEIVGTINAIIQS